MIPIDPSKPLEVKDEKNGIIYYLSYLTDEKDKAYNELIKELNMSEDGTIQKDNFKKFAHSMIDLFLVGWESESKKLPDFPDSNPSKFFPGNRYEKIYRLIEKNIPELTGTDTDELKN